MTRHKISLFLLVSLFIFVGTTKADNTVLDKRVSLQVNNQPLHVVLHQIERMTGVSFAYMSGLIDKNKIISIAVNQATLKSILQKLITNPDVLLYILDNQIIFYQKDAPPPASNGTSISLSTPRPKNESKPFQKDVIVDTQHIIVLDTQHIKVYDTTHISCIDSITIFDTIVTHRYTDSLPPKGQWLLHSYTGYSWQQSAERKAEIPYYLSEKNKQITTVGISVEYANKHFCLGFGLGLEQHQWQTKYNNNIIKTDYSTIESYQNVVSWEKQVFDTISMAGKDVLVYDSIKVIKETPVFKKDTIKSNYNNTNTANYILVPLYVGYTFNVTNRISILTSLGIEMLLLTNTSGKTLLNTETGLLANLHDGLQAHYITSSLKVRPQYWVTKKIAIGLQSGVRLLLQNEFNNTALDKNIFQIPLLINFCCRIK